MIIFDLDGTLADCEHRRHFVDPEKNPDYEYSNFGKDPITREMTILEFPNWHRKDNVDIRFKPDWKSFYEDCDKDEVIEHTRFAMECLFYQENQLEIWSGRCESVRNKTQEWIHKHLGGMKRFIALKMRPIGDYTPDDQLKERWLDEAIAEGKTIDFVFDSDANSIRMWKRRGIFVFNCCQHDEEF